MKRSVPAILTALATAALLIGLCLEPSVYLRALGEGIAVWATKVLPATFPYFVLTSILSQTGAVRAVGTLFAPLTRRLYNTSGASGYACVVGFCSGYPVGARVTLDLVRDGTLARAEVERVTAFASTAGPMFVLGTVSSLLGSAKLARIVLAAHLAGALLNGLLYRSVGLRRRMRPARVSVRAAACASAGPTVARLSAAALPIPTADLRVGPVPDPSALPPAPRAAAQRPSRPDPVTGGVLSVLTVGGYIAIFYVLTEFLRRIGLLRLPEDVAERLCRGLSLPEGFGAALVQGALEVTRGCVGLGAFAESAPFACVVATTALVSAGGACIFLQSFGYLAECGVRPWVYAAEKCTQALLSAALAALLCLLVL